MAEVKSGLTLVPESSKPWELHIWYRTSEGDPVHAYLVEALGADLQSTCVAPEGTHCSEYWVKWEHSKIKEAHKQIQALYARVLHDSDSEIRYLAVRDWDGFTLYVDNWSNEVPVALEYKSPTSTRL